MTTHMPPGNEPDPIVPYEGIVQSDTIEDTTEYTEYFDSLLERFGMVIAIASTAVILLVFMCCCGALVANYTLGY